MPVPESLHQALIQTIWKSHWRRLYLIALVSLVAAFSIWATFPEGVKTDLLIRVGVSSSENPVILHNSETNKPELTNGPIQTTDPAVTIPSVESHTPVEGDATRPVMSDSNRRLDALVAAAMEWRRDPNRTIIDRVAEAYGAITDFDKKRFNTQQANAFTDGRKAHHMVMASQKSLTTATKNEIILFVTGRGKSVDQTMSESVFKNRLVTEGFHVSEEQLGADMVIELNGTVQNLSSASPGIAAVAGAVVDVSIQATWVYDSKIFFQDFRKGNGASKLQDTAIKDAFGRAAKLIFDAFGKHVDRNPPR